MDEQLLLCYSDNLMNLSSALTKRDINAFRKALHSVDDVERYNGQTSLSIFEYACQTPGCHEFIKECINAGCDVNKVNPEFFKRPIHFAVESLNYENIAALASEPSTHLDIKYENLTPLNFLAQQVTNENFDNIDPSIKLLVMRQANLNIPNQREITPILTILKNKNINHSNKEELLTFILEHAIDIDLDTYRKGEARVVLTKLFPNLQLPPVRSTDDQWNFNKLISLLRNESEAEFVHGLNAISNQAEIDLNNLFRDKDGDETLLIAAAKKDMVTAAERMLRLGADVNYSIRKNLSPIETACKYGHWKILQLFLKTPTIMVHTDEPLISIVVKKIGETVTNKCNYDKCFQLLLKNNSIDVDQLDIYNCTALHYAVKYNNQNAILLLLKKGAYIGAKNCFNRFSISDINAKVFEKHLSSCITTNNLRSGDDNFEIIFDYTNLVPTSTRKNFSEQIIEPKAKHSNGIEVCADEMAPIDFMSHSSELKHLMKHPLIASFLFLKWHRLAFIFYVNFILYTIFCFNITIYILLCYREATTSKAIQDLLWGLSLILAICIFIRELFQLILSPRIYFKNKENYLEIALVIMVGMVLSNVHVSESTRRTIAAVTILLVVGEFFILTGSLPFLSFSTHLVMLKTVSKSFLKSLLLYSIILVAFSLCFYTLLNETHLNGKTVKDSNVNNGAEEEEADDFNKFYNPGLAIIKTVVMLTGEFDAASINFNLNATSYLVFLIFVFLISTVLFNLLNGLAVSDTQAIKSEAELMNFIHRSELMASYEKILLGNDNISGCSFLLKYCVRTRISIFKEFIPMYKISVLPNSGNQILIHIPTDHKSYEVDPLIFIENNSKTLECATHCSCIGARCSSMEPKIVKFTLQLLEQKVNDSNESDEKERLEQRITNIEKSLTDISHALNVLINK